jgi:hypothetical protein
MLIVICMAAVLAPKALAASGKAGTNMCMARVPLTVISTSSHKGAFVFEADRDITRAFAGYRDTASLK